jgi:positive regulator of sigma E activity
MDQALQKPNPVCQDQNDPQRSLVKESVLVLGVDNGMATCHVPVFSACAGCHSKCVMSGEMKERILRVPVPKGMLCRPGDRIDLRIDSRFIATASFFLYMAPAMILIVFAWLGRHVAAAIGLQDPDLGSLLAVFFCIPLLIFMIIRTRKKMGGTENIHIITRSREA